MSLAELSLADLIGVIVGFIFTLLVFSYILGDNPLFRFTIHIFIGVAAGYAGIVVIYNVLLPRLIVPLFSADRGEQLLTLVPILLSLLLLAKLSPRLARLGNIPMAYLVGAGAAAAIGGTVIGTLFPQSTATINLFDLQAARETGTSIGAQFIDAVVILVGTLTTLAYFHFGVRSRPDRQPQRQAWIDGLGQVGSVFIAIAFGVLFAGVYAASLTALVQRLYFLVDFLKPLLMPLS
jgi:hypothetical protein